MKTYALFLGVFLSLITQVSFAQDDFVSPRLFVEEALRDYNSSINLQTLQMSSDLKDVSTTRLENFKAKAEIQNTLGTNYEIYSVRVMVSHDTRLSCLASIFTIDHSIMKLELAKDFVERSGLTYLSECEISDEKRTEQASPNFSIAHYAAFPKVKTLPVAAESLLQRYQLYKKIDTRSKLFQCVSKDVNSFQEPRNALAVYELENHYSVGVLIGRSNIDSEATDIPLDVGEQDLNSLDWVKDNLQFFLSMGGGVGSTFNILFKKSDCQLLGDKKGVTAMSCALDIPEESRVNKIAKVIVNFETQMVSRPVLNFDPESEIRFENFAKYQANIQFILDEPNKYHPVYPNTFYRTRLTYQNRANSGYECQFANQVQSAPAPKKHGDVAL